MRCPKCQYISFGRTDRCRNCGYDFSLTDEPEPLDLRVRSDDEPIGPMADLPLATAPADALSAHHAEVSAVSRSAGSVRTDLPLFTDRDDTPLVTPPAVPRAPLAVRRGAPAARPRPRPTLEDEPELNLEAPAKPRILAPGRADGPPSAVEGRSSLSTASALARIAAALVDGLILGSIDVAVVYFTLRLSNLQFAEVLLLPAIPMIAFLLLLNGGYLVLFTAAGGQTIGKMATGIRVIPAQSTTSAARVPFAAAVLRAASYLVSVLPAGLGFVPILFSPDGRTLHDRLADTRVVKA
jgi:uncharacterized RDD family membrane protein YckC